MKSLLAGLLFAVVTATSTLADDNKCSTSMSPPLTNGQIDYSKISNCLADIQQIYFTNQPITKLPDQMFAQMPALSNIIVKSCSLTTLDASFFGDHTPEQVAKINSLSFSNNHIEKVDANTFTKFKGLTSLNLAGNKINSLPEGTFNGLSKLEKLRLEDNQLDKLDQNIFKDLLMLQTLDLHKNQLTSFSIDLLKTAKKPIKLSLQENNISTFTVSANNDRVDYLDLQKNQLTSVPAGLEKLTALTHLLLSHNPIECTAYSFSKLPVSLTQLFVSDVKLSAMSNPLSVFGELKNLFALSVGKNGLTTISDMPNLPKLNTLVVYGNKFNGAIDFSTIKTTLPRLKEIGLSQAEPMWTCQQVDEMLTQLAGLDIIHFFYKPAYKSFGVNSVDNIGCKNNNNNNNNQLVEELQKLATELENKVQMLENKLAQQINGTSRNVAKVADDVSKVNDQLRIAEQKLANMENEVVPTLKRDVIGSKQVLEDYKAKNDKTVVDMQVTIKTLSQQLAVETDKLNSLEMAFQMFDHCAALEKCG